MKKRIIFSYSGGGNFAVPVAEPARAVPVIEQKSNSRNRSRARISRFLSLYLPSNLLLRRKHGKKSLIFHACTLSYRLCRDSLLINDVSLILIFQKDVYVIYRLIANINHMECPHRVIGDDAISPAGDQYSLRLYSRFCR